MDREQTRGADVSGATGLGTRAAILALRVALVPVWLVGLAFWLAIAAGVTTAHYVARRAQTAPKTAAPVARYEGHHLPADAIASPARPNRQSTRI